MNENENKDQSIPEFHESLGGTTAGIEPSTPTAPPVFSGMNAPKKASNWRYVFIVLGALMVLGVGLFFAIGAWQADQIKAHVSGTEFISLIVLATLVPAVAVVALINLIGLPIYMAKHKPRGIGFIVSTVSVCVSVAIVAIGAYSAYQFFVVAPRQVRAQAEVGERQLEQHQQAFEAANAAPEISKDEAVQLLKTCQLSGFYYTHQTNKSWPANGGWGELSTTGVVLTKIDGKPFRISIADRLIFELVPIAREAQRTCADGKLQFWHDGSYEQYENGHWYFGTQIVN